MAQEQIEQVPLEKIVWPDNIRQTFDEQHIGELAQTIAVHGVIQPIRGFRDGERVIGICGQQRFLATKKAGKPTIPMIIQAKPPTDAQRVETQLIENTHAPLPPCQEAEALSKAMKSGGISASQLSGRVGKSEARISKLVSLLSLPESIRRQVDRGEIPASAAYELARVKDAKVQAELASALASGRLTRDQLRGRLKTSRRADGPAPVPMNRVTLRLSGGRCLTMHGPAMTLESLISTVEEIRTRAKLALNKGHTLQTLVTVLADESKRED